MDLVPSLRQQDENKSTGRYHAEEFPIVLPEVQKRSSGRCTTTEYNRYQRARCLDTEPIIHSKGYRLFYIAKNAGVYHEFGTLDFKVELLCRQKLYPIRSGSMMRQKSRPSILSRDTRKKSSALKTFL